MAQMQSKESRTTLVIAAIALVVSIAAAGYAYAAQASVQSTNPAKTSPQTREITLVTDTVAFNETIAGVPHDVFSPPFIHVNQGDTVVIHFINTEEVNEHHTFTLQAYNIDVDLAQGQKQDIRFVANQAGIFQFYCKYHLPTMSGQLVVLPASM